MNFSGIINIMVIAAVAFSVVSCESGGGDDDKTPVLKRITVEVLDYNPAPGQFVNVFPECNEGDSYSRVLERTTYALNNDEIVTLGSFGGYVTVKTSKPVQGRFQVAGNAFVGSAEPGVVQISQDGNTWYTICGEHFKETKNISVTYMRPAETFDDETYIKYTASDGTVGYVARIPAYHEQPYFPLWKDATSGSVTFTGHRLPDNSKFDTAKEMYILASYTGYADSYPNTSSKSYLDPSDIVDENMNPTSIPSFSYIRVYTGVLQSSGILGECSTEVTGFYEVVE